MEMLWAILSWWEKTSDGQPLLLLPANGVRSIRERDGNAGLGPAELISRDINIGQRDSGIVAEVLKLQLSRTPLSTGVAAASCGKLKELI